MILVVSNTILPSDSVIYRTMASNCCRCLIDEWTEWASSAPQGNGEQRDRAVENLRYCLESKADQLDLAELELTALPEMLPGWLRKLYIGDNQFISLPATLPPSLRELDVSNNQLTTLPAMLPASLRELDVSNNQLTALPEALPPSLQNLYVTDNQLTFLPETLPVSLQELYIGFNQLTFLPETLPVSLQALYVTYNRLISLPQTLPVSLKELDVNHNRLTSLPVTLPASLEWLNISNNALTWLPATLPTSLRRLDISNNQLTSLPFNLMVFIDNLDIRGNPLVGLTSSDPSDFLGTLTHWTGGENAAQWQKIQSEDGAAVFANFLHKLYRGKNKLSETLHGRVREWLGYLAVEESSELRKQTFFLAEEAVTSCVDRASFYFNKMYWLMTEDKAIKSGVDTAHLIETIRSGFRLQVLERIALAHAQRRLRDAAGFAEEIEIYLAYQYRLRESLSLPVYTELQFAALAGLTEEEIAQAGAAVLRQEQTDFLRYLVTESTAWRQRLQSWDKGKTAAVEADYLEAIASADFSEAIERELKENGLSADDSDARCAVSKQRADTLLFEKRYQLTREYLTAHKALSCLARF